MRSTRKISRTVLLVSAAAIAVLAAAPAAAASAQLYDIEVAQLAEIDRLTALGFTIDARWGKTVRIYASVAEAERLEKMGYAPEPVMQPAPPAAKDEDPLELGTAYHDYTAVTTFLETYAAEYPDLCRLTNIGDSLQGRALWVLRITDNPGLEEDEPEFKYIATMHGDEPVGTELCLYLIDLLLTGYGTDPRMTALVNEADLSILPLMNPDGNAAGRRYNANTVDLNRSFPKYPEDFTGTIYAGEALHAGNREPETAAVMEWTAANSFVLSANFHTGAMVVNYPYDDDGTGSGVDAPSPDDALFEDISLRYSQYNTPMYTNPQFQPYGITNGALWYEIDGGMQDWNYRYAACMEVTIELWNIKWPSASTLPQFWEDNRESMLAYMESVFIGVRGIVTDALTGAPLYARATVTGNTQPVFTDPDIGDYHRLLLPGEYELTFEASGYTPRVFSGVSVGEGAATRLDVNLFPEGAEGEGEGEGAGPIIDNPHTADQNANGRVGMGELLRVIQFYTSLALHCDAATEDGFAPGAGAHDCTPHASDYYGGAADWRIDLHELLRLIQFHNAGGYGPCPAAGTEDGFCVIFPVR